MSKLLLLVYTVLCTCTSSGGETDPSCFDNCNCCIDGACGVGVNNWPNVCTKGCIDRHRGARCYERCQYTNCKSCGGSTSSKICDICLYGYYLGPNKDCTLECPSNCKACTSSTICTECKERFYDKDGSTTCLYFNCHTNCFCNQTNCIACKPGFYNSSNLCNSVCLPNCATCHSKEICNECKHGFYNGYSQDSNTFPYYSNCTYKCRNTCTQCLSYNNCLQCVNGKYGRRCEEDCSIGCKKQTCLIETGICNCSVNFTGIKCTECTVGKYGSECDKLCPEYCKNSICNKDTGFCIDGCKSETITGKTCDSCIPGMYGKLCTIPCPANCNDRKCERYSGVCSEGCQYNFNGSFCDACVRGKYGTNCTIHCPDKCLHADCEKESGHCLGCIGNFDGNKCDTCLLGYFGHGCHEKCPVSCIGNVCDIDSGICSIGCKNNYSGDKCCVESGNCVACSSNTECIKCKKGYFNLTCEERCPIYCGSSCEFGTGICEYCADNKYGSYCNYNCSDYCKTLTDVLVSRCGQLDGKCRFGCNDGYFGITCNETCSNLCVDNICTQETGKCTNGCDGVYDNSVCFLGSGNPEESNSNTVIVLGTILALIAVALITTGIGIVVWRKRSSERYRREATMKISFENATVTTERNQETEGNCTPYDTISTERESIVVTGMSTDEYEQIGRVEEHEYQQMDIPASDIPEAFDVDSGIDYYNLNPL